MSEATNARRIVRLGITFVMLFILVVGCANGLGQKRPRVRVDASHGELFSVFGERPLDYSAFGRMMTDAGLEVVEEGTPLTPASLAGIRALVIAGPTQPIQAAEIQTLRRFVEEGGRLLLLLHIAPPVARLTETYGIFVSNYVISDREGMLKDNPQDFFVTRFSTHPLTKGLSRIAVFGTWGLLAEGEAQVVCSTSGEAWVDFNRNRIPDDDEPMQSFGILAVAVAEAGKGRVIVVADDAPFATMFLDEAENRTLAANIVEWLR